MRDEVLQKAAKYAKTRQRKKRWQKLVTCMAAVVVFCTTYALILPAITLEQEQCGIPEHVHSEACYTQVDTGNRSVPVCSVQSLDLHKHTTDCYDGEGRLTCGYADFVVHEHDTSCYDEDGQLWCPLPEIQTHTHTDSCYAVSGGDAEPAHVHTEDCYTLRKGGLTCTTPESQGHTHDDACYTEVTTLVCTTPESDGHQHGADCYDGEGNLTCTLAESEGHHHGESCYEVTRELTCQLAEEAGHQHTDDCYAWEKVLTCGQSTEPVAAEPELVCGKEEVILHQHTGSCFDRNGALICGKTEVCRHVHSDGCFQTEDAGALTCGLDESEEHTHSALCYGAWELTCGLEEHTHSLACYSDPTADVETAADWEQTLPEAYSGDWRQDVLSVAVSQLGYHESTSNYQVDEDGVTTKGYTRYGAWYGDPYGDWCAMFVSFCLNYAQVPQADFPWNANCQNWIETLSEPEFELYHPANAGGEAYLPSPGDLIFFCWDQDGKADHVGLVTEYIPGNEQTPAQVKTLEGNSGDTVQYRFYELTDKSILGYGTLPEQVFTCGKTGHVHGEACVNGRGQIVCGQEEHIHTDVCQEPQEVPDEGLDEEREPAVIGELTSTGPDYTVTVRYGADAALPEGVVLEAEEILQDSEEYLAYYTQSVEALGGTETETPGTLVFARFFDVHFLLDGEPVEPAAPVSVTITYASELETDETSSCQAIHFAEEGPELIEVETESPEPGEVSFTHTQDSFSVVGSLITVSYSGENSTDVGPSSLPVDYYVYIDGVWTCVGSTKTGWYGDYNATGWTDTNRDYITLAQAESILKDYGFQAADGDALNKKLAYQQKAGNTSIYADVNTPAQVGDRQIVPLSRNEDHPGYNLYYLPGNTAGLSNISPLSNLSTAGSCFYTVKVYNAQGELLNSAVVRENGSYTYDASGSGVSSWLVTYGNSGTQAITGSTIEINNITAPVTVSPKQDGTAGSRSVTFKVLIDGTWQTVGSLPYYYSGTVNGQQRAYITSGMAAQFFGAYGYSATEAPGYQIGYSYNDIYNILFAPNTGFAMDVTNANIVEGVNVQLYTFNGTDAQTFRIWEAEAGYSYITPVTNSALHVNVLGGGSANDAPIGLHSATDGSSRWRLQWESDGRVSFWTKNAPNSACIDVDGGATANGTKIHIWNGVGNCYWRLSQVYRISNTVAAQPNADDTYNIGLTPESNGDIVCYYLPGVTDACTDLTEEEIAEKVQQGIWTVSVRDDTHSVYTEGELSQMTQYVANGGTATVTVKNEKGILWSCTGIAEEYVRQEQSGGNTTFTLTNVTQPVEVVATKVDPSFTVQYYANIDRYVLGGSGNLDIIDTSGGNLPQNTANQSLLWLTLEDTGVSTNQNNGNQTSLHRVKTEKQLTQMYTDGTYNYEQYPGLEYFDKLWGQSNYVLDAVLVLKDGKSPDSTNDDDWWWYEIDQSTWSNITFTNLASEENAPRQEGVKQGRDGDYCILLQEDTVLRLRYETNNQAYTNQASFHDYDITSGMNADGTWRSGVTGINTDSNYVTSRNGQRKFTWNGVGSSTADVFAFGNQNCETGMGLAQWGGNNINAYNGTSTLMENGLWEDYGNDVYNGCTFGLVDGLDASGNLIWDERITAPHLFNDGDAIGKHSYNNGSLQFNQTGDTYTLTAANSTVGSRDNLEYFFHPSPSSGTTHTHIYTNNFWPMDSATDKTDPLMGAKNATLNQCDIQVNGFWDAQNQVGGNHDNVNVPISDDGRAHNWFFGMNFSLSFTLTEDYMGPLEYIFFGDDDLWVFLDGKLICDIGGVHSSVGEYVNLWDYLEKGDAKRHTLSFFYTERGASGSTCWMSFTLPSVTSAATGINTGSLQVSKEVSVGGSADVNDDYKDMEYKFKVELLTGKNGSPLSQMFSYARSGGTYGTIKSGATLTLGAGETATISGIPAGTFYRVTELSTEGYKTTVDGEEGYIASGTIENGGTKPASFVNTPFYELPESGGPTTLVYTFSGITLMAGALVYYIRSRRRKGAR